MYQQEKKKKNMYSNNGILHYNEKEWIAVNLKNMDEFYRHNADQKKPGWFHLYEVQENKSNLLW